MSLDLAGLAAELIASAITSFESSKSLAGRAVMQLSDEKLRVALDENTNSIAVIMKHVAGNLRSRWTDPLTTDGEKPWRNRDGEFVDSFNSRQEIIEDWEAGWACLFDALRSMRSEDVSKSMFIRGERHSVPLAIQRSLAHCSYHCGQIVMLARVLAGDKWETLTIPRGESETYNHAVWGPRVGTPASSPREADNPGVIPMTADHLEEVIALWNATEGLVLTFSDNVPDLKRYLDSNPGMSHVAVRDGHVVAAVLCGHDGRRGYLHHLAVAADRRNQGIGRALVKACLSNLLATGIQQCNLFILEDHAAGREFWTREGWSEWPTIRLLSKRLDDG